MLEVGEKGKVSAERAKDTGRTNRPTVSVIAERIAALVDQASQIELSFRIPEHPALVQLAIHETARELQVFLPAGPP